MRNLILLVLCSFVIFNSCENSTEVSKSDILNASTVDLQAGNELNEIPYVVYPTMPIGQNDFSTVAVHLDYLVDKNLISVEKHGSSLWFKFSDIHSDVTFRMIPEEGPPAPPTTLGKTSPIDETFIMFW